jgi:RNA polymerase-binding transcription factor DksA
MIEEEVSVQHSNIEESEMGALQALHLNENAVWAVRQRIGSGPGLLNCMDCGLEIPLARRLAVAGCKTCIVCQTKAEM